ncbi:TetR/AcrR family transcriptional regulator [Tissierella sp. MB52-C2]|uniref:TetR/AcrR family transcriptional regulator n=1 Tax=Tissierella sp. MB52-C2 TaxID=3070999 RepID=UPI00280B6DE9|nr:TetR/AcrR family transcriptional regulator [Tissierella sp. MB52-C2]WMM23475.1 TetR/AcrR family transcriptional regulator [Tissierella sp. MB52-C2]
MLTKSELKKRLILEKSRKIFIEKGYKKVTMTDIVEACEISRGGLYMYYKSTHEIFLEVLRIDQEGVGFGFLDGMKNGISGVEILEDFLQEQKEELLNKDQNLAVAIYEFFFLNIGNIEENILKEQFDSAVKILSELIQYGMDRGEFNSVNKEIAAKNIILLLEGIRVSSEVMNITDELIDEQFNYIKDILVN